MKQEILLFVVYTVAQLLVFFHTAAKSVAVEATPWETVLQYLKAHWRELSQRWVVCTALFFLLWEQPDLVSAVLAHFGFVLNFHLGLGWTIVLGFGSDKISDILLTLAQWAYQKVKGLVA